MGSHPFNFAGGAELSSIGASWFVSFAYCTYIDNTHENWKLVKTHPYRTKIFDRTKTYHKYWLEKVKEMNNDKLKTNDLDLNASRVKEMAEDLLSTVFVADKQEGKHKGNL
jgi:hypothetical protein